MLSMARALIRFLFIKYLGSRFQAENKTKDQSGHLAWKKLFFPLLGITYAGVMAIVIVVVMLVSLGIIFADVPSITLLGMVAILLAAAFAVALVLAGLSLPALILYFAIDDDGNVDKTLQIVSYVLEVIIPV